MMINTITTKPNVLMQGHAAIKYLYDLVLNRVKPCIAKANPRYSPIEKAVNHFV